MSVNQPVFILASPHSFTSIVCAMLGQHPEAYGVPELNLFVAETLDQMTQRLQGQYRFMMHGLLRTVAQLYAGEQTMQSVNMARRWIQKRLQYSTGEVYVELCQKVAPLRIIDKSPGYSRNLEILKRIQETFPGAYYLYLVRHPRTQGESMMRAFEDVAGLVMVNNSIDYSTEPPTIDPQYAWYEKQNIILEFLSTVPSAQQMTLRGEAILNDPRQYLEKICQWLNFAWDEAIFEAMLRTQDSAYACMGPYGAQYGNNPGFQKSPAFRYRAVASSKLEGSLPWRHDDQGFIPAIAQLAQKLGYE